MVEINPESYTSVWENNWNLENKTILKLSIFKFITIPLSSNLSFGCPILCSIPLYKHTHRGNIHFPSFFLSSFLCNWYIRLLKLVLVMLYTKTLLTDFFLNFHLDVWSNHYIFSCSVRKSIVNIVRFSWNDSLLAICSFPLISQW